MVPGICNYGGRTILFACEYGPSIKNFLAGNRCQAGNERNRIRRTGMHPVKRDDCLIGYAHCNRCQSYADKQSDDSFNAPVTVGMGFIRRRAPEFDPHEDGDVGNRIGQAVKSVSKDRLASSKKTGDNFKTGQQDINEHTNPGNQLYLTELVRIHNFILE
jgi:hypothetical protein